VFAGMVALLNQNFQGTSAAGLGNINPMLYELAQTTPNNYFHSLTTGNNQVFCVAGDPPNQPSALQCPQPPATAVIGFDASNADPVSGYNLVNGLGSVDLNNLAIAWAAARAGANFTWASSDHAHTVKAGQTTAAYNFTATPLGSAAFAAPVTFACSGLPDATASCVFTPAFIAAGQTATPVALTITTKGPNTGTGAALQHRADRRSPWLPLMLPIAGIVMAGFVGRKLPRSWAVAALFVWLALLGLMVACGGGSSTPPPPVTLTVSPSTAVSLFPNNAADGWPAQTQTFTASVSNTSNTAVTWSVSPSGGGTIDANGAYTAPTLAAGLPATVTVRATSQADASKSATGTVNLQTPTTLGTFTVTVTATEAQTQKSPSVTLTVQ
jgi:hypothetical protein